MKNNEKIIKPHIVLVEGDDEVTFFQKLTQKLGLNVQVIPIGGKNALKNYLELLVLRPEFEYVSHMAILMDSDQEQQATFQSICYHLEKQDLPIPARIGEVADKQGKHTGIYLIPGAGQQGALEDLLLDCISNTHPLDCIDPYWQCLESLTGEEQIKLPKNRMKFKLRTLLAAMEEDTRSIGQAMDKGYIDVNHPNLDPLRTFLRKLFAP